MSGVEETAAKFVREDLGDFKGLRRFRTIAGVGPTYEVLSVDGQSVEACIVDTGERFTYPIADARVDPLA